MCAWAEIGISRGICCCWCCIPPSNCFLSCPQHGTFTYACRVQPGSSSVFACNILIHKARTVWIAPPICVDAPCWSHHLHWCQTALLQSHEINHFRETEVVVIGFWAQLGEQSELVLSGKLQVGFQIQKEGRTCVIPICQRVTLWHPALLNMLLNWVQQALKVS